MTLSWLRNTFFSLHTRLLSAHLSLYAATTRSHSTHLANVSEYAGRYISSLSEWGDEEMHPKKHQRRWRRATKAAVLAGVFFANAPPPHPSTLRAPGPDSSFSDVSALENMLPTTNDIPFLPSTPIEPEMPLLPEYSSAVSPALLDHALEAVPAPLLTPEVITPIPIFMYHGIGVPESRFRISPQRLISHLDAIVNAGYSFVTFYEATQMSADDRKKGKYAVLTFDDGTEDHFRILSSGAIDPHSAVGILQTYERQHPSVDVTATFFVNGTRPNGDPPFGQEEWVQYKLFQLLRMGYEVGSHGAIHESFGNRTLEEIAANIAVFQNHMAHLLPSVDIVSFAYPNGSIPDKRGQQIVESMYPATAAAWGGVYADDHDYNVPRIEMGPDSRIERYLLSDAISSAGDRNASKRNAYKEVGVRAEYERSTSQLPPQSAHTNPQPDGSGRGWRERSRERADPRRQEGSVFNWQEGDRGRDSCSSWKQGCASRSLRDRNARSSFGPECEDSVIRFSSPTYLALTNPVQAYCSITSFFDALRVHTVLNKPISQQTPIESLLLRAIEWNYPLLSPISNAR